LNLERKVVELSATNAMLDSELKGLINKHDASQQKVCIVCVLFQEPRVCVFVRLVGVAEPLQST
jgi:hypothetical protein